MAWYAKSVVPATPMQWKNLLLSDLKVPLQTMWMFKMCSSAWVTNEPRAANQTCYCLSLGNDGGNGCGLTFELVLNLSLKIPLHLATWLAKSMQWCPRWPLTLVVWMPSMRNTALKKLKRTGRKLTISVREGMHEFARGLR